MSEEKTTSTKRTTKKVGAVTEVDKPKKAATAPKAKSTASEKTLGSKKVDVTPTPAKAVGKASTASKTTSPKQTTKTVAAASELTKPKKALAAPKATSTIPEKPVSPRKAAGAVPAAKSVSKATSASKSATTKPEGDVKKKVSASSNLVERPSALSQEERQRWIATAAFHRAEKRGFTPGYEVQDWLDAEAEINVLVGKA